jgi:hypothetical protein
MPKAIVDTNDITRYELRTCPGGYVVLRRMTYGQWLQRNERALLMQAQRTTNKKGTETVDMQLQGKAVALYEYSVCMVEHNLEDAEGNLLDFRKPVTLEILDPRVGNEIGTYITEMNDFQEDEAGN